MILYDIEKIMDTDFGKSIGDKELYDSVVRHRSVFNRVDGIDYDSHKPSSLSFIPPNSIINDWEKDYESMQRYFIYDSNSLSFSELIKRMQELKARIRNTGKTD